MVESLGELAAVLLAVSLASERFVVLCKTAFPGFLASRSDPGADVADVRRTEERERWRRLGVIGLGFVSSYVTVAILAGSGWPNATIDMAGRLWPVAFVAFLATGGSAFWAQVVGYASALKDVRRLERDLYADDRPAPAPPSEPPPPSPGPPSSPASLPFRAVEHMRGLHPGADFVADGEVQSTSAGVRIVHLQQTFAGIPVLGSATSVRFRSDGSVKSARGGPVSIVPTLSSVPSVTALSAVRAALAGLAEVLEDAPAAGAIQIRRQFATASRPTVLSAEGVEDEIDASLAYWPGDSGVRLAWVVHVALPDTAGEWEWIVAADEGSADLLHHRRTVAHAACGLHPFNPDSPRTDRTMPAPAGEYPVPLPSPTPPSFAHEWISDDETEGNNAACYRHNSSNTFQGDGSSGEVVFELPESEKESEGQQLISAFYWANWLHDFFLLLGFDERARNFQEDNLTGEGKDRDRLVVRVFQHGFAGIASMRSRLDGKRPVLKLGPRLDRHAALDAEVVVHEFVHGVTNRLIGGRDHQDPLRWREQSEAMGEGYSDYFALTVVNALRHRDGEPESTVFGRWIAPEPDRQGLRNHDYAGDVGTAASLGQDGWKKPHDAGQVWGKALLLCHAALQDELGRADGDALGWQVVTDSLKLLTPHGKWPNMLDGRDAVYDAFDDLADVGRIPGDVPKMRAALEAAFSGLLLGAAATSDGADYEDLTPGP